MCNECTHVHGAELRNTGMYVSDRYTVITVRPGDGGVYFKHYFSFFLQQGFLCNFENNKY